MGTDEVNRAPRPPHPPRILCVGIAVLDHVFQVEAYPERDCKTTARGFVSVIGGGAVNAAIAIARLGGVARFAGPLGGAGGADPIGDRILADLTSEGIACDCLRVDNTISPVSAVLVDAQGGRTIAHHRDSDLRVAKAVDPDRLVTGIDGVLADDHYPEFATPVCMAARRRGLPVVLDIEKLASPDHPLLNAATHRVFSRAGLSATTGEGDPATGLLRLENGDGAFLAVTDGAGPVLWRAGGMGGEVPTFAVEAIDTLAAGDVFHGAFALALLEAGDGVRALRFAAAVAAIKCTRFGGGAAAPTRAELERFLCSKSGEELDFAEEFTSSGRLVL